MPGGSGSTAFSGRLFFVVVVEVESLLLLLFFTAKLIVEDFDVATFKFPSAIDTFRSGFFTADVLLVDDVVDFVFDDSLSASISYDLRSCLLLLRPGDFLLLGGGDLRLALRVVVVLLGGDLRSGLTFLFLDTGDTERLRYDVEVRGGLRLRSGDLRGGDPR